MPTPTPPKSVLVVDDDHDLVLILEDFLKEAGYQVEVAHNGLEALTMIRSHHFDAVVCDLFMTRMGGELLYREVERSAPWMMDRFLFVSGMAGMSDAKAFLSRTGVRSLEKPFHADEVLQVVSEIIAENET